MQSWGVRGDAERSGMRKKQGTACMLGRCCQPWGLGGRGAGEEKHIHLGTEYVCYTRSPSSRCAEQATAAV
eukprot:10314136-Prorocentrum_lima.AAC.1